MKMVKVEISALEEIIEILESIDCQFFACDGPDKPFNDMQTCNRCYAIQQVKKMINKP